MKSINTYKLVPSDKRYMYEAKIPKGARIIGCSVRDLDGLRVSAVASDKHKPKERRFMAIPENIAISDYDSRHYEYVGSALWGFDTVYVFEVHE